MGAGGCRGDGWTDKDNDWPKVVEKGKAKTAGQCCQACAKAKGCTAFHIDDDEGACVLFGHKDVVPVAALGGRCYTINRKKGERRRRKKNTLGNALKMLSAQMRAFVSRCR